ALAAGLLVLGLGARALVAGIDPTPFAEGLVTALDRIGGNLLGDAVWDAAAPIPEDGSPAPLRLFVATDPPNPVELILAYPPDPVAPFFRATVGTDGSLTLEFDSVAAGFPDFPKVVPADLSAVGVPVPEDGEPQEGNFNDGLVIALDKVGGNLLGEGTWDATAGAGINPCFRVWLGAIPSHPIELVLYPPDPIAPFFRLTLGTDGGLTLEFDVVAAGDMDFPEVLAADLSGLEPPEAD
ncbi:MAG: hypothetical protein L0323_17750, partial [Planctomycetes bacterium]|nr:hypothetical protein [Planctomycetota bacterium]